MSRSFHLDMEPKLWIRDLKFRPPSLAREVVEKEKFEYTMSKIPIGITRNGRYHLNFSISMRNLVVGKTNSGKSFLMHTIIDRFVKSGGCVFILDVRGEYLTTLVPVQDHLRRYLLPGEQPSGMDTHSYYPRFFDSGYTPLEGFEEYMDIDLGKITFEDFSPIIGKLTDNEANLLKECFNAKLKTLSEFFGYMNTSNYQYPTIRNLTNKLQLLSQSRIIGNNMPNIKELIKPNRINILNFSGVDGLGREIKVPAETLALFLKRIFAYKQNNPEVKVLIVVEELPRWLDNESVMGILMDMLTRGRLIGISMLFSIQTKGIKVSEPLDKIFSQISHCFLPNNIDFSELTEIYKRLMPTEYDYPVNFKYKVSEMYMKMKKYGKGVDAPRDWLVIEQEDQDSEVFAPISPLSWHIQEGQSAKNIVKKELLQSTLA